MGESDIGLLKYIVLFGMVALIVSNVPIFQEFKTHEFVPPKIIELKGPFEFNEDLRKTEKLFEGKLLAPESLAVYHGAFFTGLENGQIVKVEGEKITVLPEILGVDGKQVQRRFLGMRVYKDKLLALDAYNGLYSIDAKTYKSELLLSSFDKDGNTQYNFMDDLDIDPETDTVYISLASKNFDLGGSFKGFIGADTSGSVIKFDLKTKKVETVVDNLGFANGVQLSNDGQSVLISETYKFRVMRYHIKGPKKGSLELFADLPGMPDNIRQSGKGGYWIALPYARNRTTLIEYLAPYPMIRKILYRTSNVIGKALNKIESYRPNPTFKKIAMAFEHGEILVVATPMLSMIVEIDDKGVIRENWQSTDFENNGAVTEVLDFKGNLYLGSFKNDFLLRAKNK